MPRVRILHLVARSHRRGAELVALELADELRALGHHNEVLALGLALDGGRDPDLPPLLSRVSVGPDVLALSCWRVHQHLARAPVDVVLAHGGLAAQVAAAALPRDGTLLVWQRILGFPPEMWHPARRRVWRSVARRVDVAVALTSDLEGELRRLGFTGPVWVIPNFRQPERFADVDRALAAERLRREIGVDDAVPLLGFVGHLVDQKRPERAIEVLAAVLGQGERAHLVIAGDGPLRPRVEQEVRSRGLTEHVTMLGHRRDVELVYGGVELLLLTSDAEGIPGVAIEAQMTGCPVITFPCGSVHEVVEDGTTGVVLPRVDVPAMADSVVTLLADDDRRRRLGAAARERTPDFAASRTAGMYAARLLELLDHPAEPVDSSNGSRVSRPDADSLVAGGEPVRDQVPPPGIAARAGPKGGALDPRMPNLFVLGAPKAGTTFVHHALSRAPDVFMSSVKEPGYFTSSRDQRRGLEYYLNAYFSGAEGHSYRGESTPWYLYSEPALERIAALPSRSELKLLVLIRRPSARALSMYRDQVRIQREHRSFGEAVDAELELLCAGELGPDVRQRYVWCGRYSEHIRRWQEAFGENSLHVLLFEEMALEPAKVWAELASFLGCDLGPSRFEEVEQAERNPAGSLRWPRLDRLIRSLEGRDNRIIETAKQMLPPGLHRRVLQRVVRYNRRPGGSSLDERDPQVLERLDAHFQGEREALEALLGRSLDCWSAPGPFRIPS
jgi:glycosyltransferase involved in cell wall biosynthesis